MQGKKKFYTEKTLARWKVEEAEAFQQVLDEIDAREAHEVADAGLIFGVQEGVRTVSDLGPSATSGRVVVLTADRNDAWLQVFVDGELVEEDGFTLPHVDGWPSDIDVLFFRQVHGNDEN